MHQDLRAACTVSKKLNSPPKIRGSPNRTATATHKDVHMYMLVCKFFKMSFMGAGVICSGITVCLTCERDGGGEGQEQ